jgi:predicted membrane protein (TIGR00267 family)
VEKEESEEDSQSGLNNLLDKITDRLREASTYLRVTQAPKILRRYFAMNAFDGAMTSLGVIIGAYLTNITDPGAVVGVIIVGGVAMMVSGFSGTYMAESAERSHTLNELEDAMLIDLDQTIYGQASRFVSLFAAIVDGSAPFLASIPAIVPFVLAELGLITPMFAYTSSVLTTLVTLFLLGVFLGKISKNNVYFSGFKMVIAGIAVALIALFLNVH